MLQNPPISSSISANCSSSVSASFDSIKNSSAFVILRLALAMIALSASKKGAWSRAMTLLRTRLVLAFSFRLFELRNLSSKLNRNIFSLSFHSRSCFDSKISTISIRTV